MSSAQDMEVLLDPYPILLYVKTIVGTLPNRGTLRQKRVF